MSGWVSSAIRWTFAHMWTQDCNWITQIVHHQCGSHKMENEEEKLHQLQPRERDDEILDVRIILCDESWDRHLTQCPHCPHCGKRIPIGRRVQGRPRADRHKWSEITSINGRKSMGFTTVVNAVTPANPRLPNTLWGGIWTPKSYPKDQTWSGIRKTREMALFHLTYTMSPQTHEKYRFGPPKNQVIYHKNL